LLSDHTDPSMPFPAARPPDSTFHYQEHSPGALAALLDVSDRRWFTVVVTGALALVLAGIVYAAFTIGGGADGGESILAVSTLPNATTSSVPEGSAGAATTLDPTSSTGDDSSSASIQGTVVTSESSETSETSESSTSTTEATSTTSTTEATSSTVALVTVPGVSGMGRVTASETLRAAGLEVQVTERRVPVGSGQNALVIDQTPAAGTEVDPGTVVTIVVAQESSNQGNN
jgi:hypothetical protein